MSFYSTFQAAVLQPECLASLLKMLCAWLAAAATTHNSVLLTPKTLLPRRLPPESQQLPQQKQQQLKSDAAVEAGSEQEELFTDTDWDRVIKGYTSQYVERDYWVDACMVEGAHMRQTHVGCRADKVLFACSHSLSLSLSPVDSKRALDCILAALQM